MPIATLTCSRASGPTSCLGCSTRPWLGTSGSWNGAASSSGRRRSKAATTLWLQHANPLPAFIEAHCVRKDRCLLKRFYEAYSNWTREMGYTLTQTQQAMTRNLEHLGYATKKTNKGVAVIGLTLSPEATRLRA
jgi:hypothetical protein